MTRCAICGNLLQDDTTVREQFTGHELEVCKECNSKLEGVKETAQELDDANYIAARESLMLDEKKGRSEAANRLLEEYCRKCRNPDRAKEPNSFVEQIQQSMLEEEEEIRSEERTLKMRRIGLVTRVLALLIFIGGVIVSIFLGFAYMHVSVNYMTGSSVSSYNYAIAVFGSLAFFLCALLILAIGEHFQQESLRTQMMEKLYYKIFDTLDRK